MIVEARQEAQTQPKARAALAAVADLRHTWSLGLGQGIVETFLGGTAALLPLGLPQILIHGTLDEPVPFVISQAYHTVALAGGDDCTLLTLDGLGHFELTDPTSMAWPSVLDAARRLCAVPA